MYYSLFNGFMINDIFKFKVNSVTEVKCRLKFGLV